VTRGIVEAHIAGSVTSTSMMVNTPGFEDAAERARSLPTLGIGLHLNLVHGRPLTAVPTLTDRRTGAFHSLGALAWRAIAGLISPDEVVQETAAQIERLYATGIPITHLDGHRHAHILPNIWAPVVKAALEQDIHIIRRPCESLRLNPANAQGTFNKAGLRVALRLARREGVRGPDHFAGISIRVERPLVPQLLALLDSLAPGSTELMVHVGHADAELAALDPYTAPREAELAALTSPELRVRLERGDIELVNFGAL